jgi:hypothetical protein
MSDETAGPRPIADGEAQFLAMCESLVSEMEADHWTRLAEIVPLTKIMPVLGIAGEMTTLCTARGYAFGRRLAAEGTLAWVLTLLDTATVEGNSAMEVAEVIRAKWPEFREQLSR